MVITDYIQVDLLIQLVLCNQVNWPNMSRSSLENLYHQVSANFHLVFSNDKMSPILKSIVENIWKFCSKNLFWRIYKFILMNV